MRTGQRALLGAGVLAVVAVYVGLAVRGPAPTRLSLAAPAVCLGAPARGARPYDRSRGGVHQIALDGMPATAWQGWAFRPESWFAQTVRDMELVVCVTDTLVVVDTCGPYTSLSSGAPYVTLAVRKWTFRLVEARTAAPLDTLHLEGSSECPRWVGDTVTYHVVEAEDSARSVALREWIRRYVEKSGPTPH